MLIWRDGSVLEENFTGSIPKAWKEKAARGWKRTHIVSRLYFHSSGATIIDSILHNTSRRNNNTSQRHNESI